MLFAFSLVNEVTVFIPNNYALIILQIVLVNKNTLETVQYGVEGSTTFLECQARTPHGSLKWHLVRENSDRRKEVSKDLSLSHRLDLSL